MTITTTASATTRLSRAAVMAFTTLGAGLGVAVSGCPKTPETVIQPYGAPPTPTPDAGADGDPTTSPGGPVALYGAAPPPEQDANAVPIVPPYGAPSPSPTLY